MEENKKRNFGNTLIIPSIATIAIGYQKLLTKIKT